MREGAAERFPPLVEFNRRMVADLESSVIDKQKATIPLLYDLDGSVMEAYKIAFTIPEYLQAGYKMFGGYPDANPETGWRIPVPATFVVDQKGVIRGRHVNADYTYRMEPAEILAVLKEIVSEG